MRRDDPKEIEKACFKASLKVKFPTKGNDGLWAAIEAVRACAFQSFKEGMDLEGALFLRSFSSVSLISSTYINAFSFVLPIW